MMLISAADWCCGPAGRHGLAEQSSSFTCRDRQLPGISGHVAEDVIGNIGALRAHKLWLQLPACQNVQTGMKFLQHLSTACLVPASSVTNHCLLVAWRMHAHAYTAAARLHELQWLLETLPHAPH